MFAMKVASILQGCLGAMTKILQQVVSTVCAAVYCWHWLLSLSPRSFLNRPHMLATETIMPLCSARMEGDLRGVLYLQWPIHRDHEWVIRRWRCAAKTTMCALLWERLNIAWTLYLFVIFKCRVAGAADRNKQRHKWFLMMVYFNICFGSRSASLLNNTVKFSSFQIMRRFWNRYPHITFPQILTNSHWLTALPTVMRCGYCRSCKQESLQHGNPLYLVFLCCF